MDLHHGRITVASEGEGKGSTFSVVLPMRRAHAAVMRSASSQGAPARLNRHVSEQSRRLGAGWGGPLAGTGAGDVGDSSGRIGATLPLSMVNCLTPRAGLRQGSVLISRNTSAQALAGTPGHGSGQGQGPGPSALFRQVLALGQGLGPVQEGQGPLQGSGLPGQGLNSPRDPAAVSIRSPEYAHNTGAAPSSVRAHLVAPPLSYTGAHSLAPASAFLPSNKNSSESVPSVQPVGQGPSIPLLTNRESMGSIRQQQSLVGESVGVGGASGSRHGKIGGGAVDALEGNEDTDKAREREGVLGQAGQGEVEGEVPWNILVVDDSALNRKMLVKLFKTVGQAVEEAVDGQDAVNRVTRRKAEGLPEYNAILMDFVMVRGRWEGVGCNVVWGGVLWKWTRCVLLRSLFL